jgi:hypothetical protein
VSLVKGVGPIKQAGSMKRRRSRRRVSWVREVKVWKEGEKREKDWEKNREEKRPVLFGRAGFRGRARAPLPARVQTGA